MLNWQKYIFAQERIGKGGKPFKIYKIRTMNGMNNCAWGRKELRDPNDPRVTKLGRFLRRYWLDELPQIVNIFRGEMGWFGVRPLTKEDYDNLPPDLQQKRSKYLPGLYNALHAEDYHTWEEKVEAERRYFEMKEKYPVAADTVYFLKFLENTILGRVKGT